MKTRRRRGRRKARRNPLGALALANPTRRRRTVRRRRRNPPGAPLFTRATRRQRRRYLRRRRNPGLFSFLRRRRRHRNPGGMLAKGFALATAAAGLQFALMFVPPVGGVSAFADAGRTAALGWLAGIAMKRTGILSQFADDVTLAGFTLAGGKVITAFILPWANRIFARQAVAQATQPAPMGSGSMSGIGLYRDGMVPYKRYMPPNAGMNGIGLYHDGMVPYPDYTPIPVA